MISQNNDAWFLRLTVALFQPAGSLYQFLPEIYLPVKASEAFNPIKVDENRAGRSRLAHGGIPPGFSTLATFVNVSF